jgi:hypothetical protein
VVTRPETSLTTPETVEPVVAQPDWRVLEDEEEYVIIALPPRPGPSWWRSDQPIPW